MVSDFGGEVPRTMEEMLTIPGAARKTANVVLGTAYGIAAGIVVDTHVQRLSARLDLTKEHRPGEDRAGPDQDRSARQVDSVRAPVDPARPRAVPGPQSEVRASASSTPLCYAKDKTL